MILTVTPPLPDSEFDGNAPSGSEFDGNAPVGSELTVPPPPSGSEFDGNVTDSEGDESVLHPYGAAPSAEDYETASSRYPPSDYRDDYSNDWSAASGRLQTRTRSEVPVYRPRQGRRPRQRHVVPQQPAFM